MSKAPLYALKIEPVPCRGAQKLWRVEGELLDQVRAAYRQALQATAESRPVEAYGR